jgi:CheY-like chemotaxis protein
MVPAISSNARRVRVLVVDDEESNRTFAESALAEAGYEVMSASSGPVAMITAEQQGPFDLFVVDVRMPQMRGDELGRRLALRYRDARVLYFTGDGQWVATSPELTPHEAIVQKPATLDELLQAVSQLLFGHPDGLTAYETI